ncbi:hypothetical protein DACRYDRAFT_112233 [Dacryopinax primogenitus]|uniref:Uncharacterized protein n=1 Tax=Dacryopinax primogenitus (strain DJM 731) TaxID=1858805 RepID=M5FP89_DACPD|nr:uncharacterized protein DACRYDRAFT_112233 [Dacryopinax primogenitus]EJT96893.1 hypothetical protein DACRYDRAFT_112233 [Dacryopinax primogenitus]
MSVTWSSADLGTLVPGDPPVTLRYFDTHPLPSNQDESTAIIALHGLGWNSKIFLPWLSHAPRDLRVLGVNRRGYEGSSPPHPQPGTFGRELIALLAFVRSKGTAPLVSLLSHLSPSQLGKPSPSLPVPFQPYLPSLSLLRSMILFEPPQVLVGLPGPASYPGLGDIQPSEMGPAFAAWHRARLPQDRLGVVDAASDGAFWDEDMGAWYAAEAERGE